jgi:hypothetical protein
MMSFSKYLASVWMWMKKMMMMGSVKTDGLPWCMYADDGDVSFSHHHEAWV